MHAQGTRTYGAQIRTVTITALFRYMRLDLINKQGKRGGTLPPARYIISRTMSLHFPQTCTLTSFFVLQVRAISNRICPEKILRRDRFRGVRILQTTPPTKGGVHRKPWKGARRRPKTFLGHPKCIPNRKKWAKTLWQGCFTPKKESFYQI